MEIEPLTPAIGARISGVNLADSPGEAQLEAGYGALDSLKGAPCDA